MFHVKQKGEKQALYFLRIEKTQKKSRKQVRENNRKRFQKQPNEKQR